LERKGRREYLDDSKTGDLMNSLFAYFEVMVDVPRVKCGSRQTIETLINEEAFLFCSIPKKRETSVDS